MLAHLVVGGTGYAHRESTLRAVDALRATGYEPVLVYQPSKNAEAGDRIVEGRAEGFGAIRGTPIPTPVLPQPDNATWRIGDKIYDWRRSLVCQAARFNWQGDRFTLAVMTLQEIKMVLQLPDETIMVANVSPENVGPSVYVGTTCGITLETVKVDKFAWSVVRGTMFGVYKGEAKLELDEASKKELRYLTAYPYELKPFIAEDVSD